MNNGNQPEPREAVAQARGKDRSFISDEEIQNVVYQGKPGYKIKVRLTSYRSLPLSCIEKIQLSVDGKAIPQDCLTFILNGYSHKLTELSMLNQIWWFILDYAELFVESEQPLSDGKHLVDGLLVTVEPYMTGGRFSFYYPSQKQLRVAMDNYRVPHALA